jgi:hypothetical protein
MRYSFVVPDDPELHRTVVRLHGDWRSPASFHGIPETALAASLFVIRGLDPRIHPSSQGSYEEDGLPGQARQ